MINDDFRDWQWTDMVQFYKLGSVILPPESIKSIVGNTLRHPFQYRQIQRLIGQRILRAKVFRPLTLFELIICSGDKKKLLSKLYAILINGMEIYDKNRTWWVKDLNKSYSESTWEKIRMVSYTFSCSVGLQENSYKIINMWNLTQRRVSRMYPQIPDNCW